jgi:hypothetical protein
MYTSINRHHDVVIRELVRVDDPTSYLELRARLTSPATDVASDAAVQRLYRDYWRMNVARLGDRFYARYFQLLAHGQRAGSVDIGAVARELEGVAEEGKRRSLQFSFASKLAHMVDPRVPVYDSFVAAFYFYDPPTSDRPLAERLDGLLTFHGFLRREYERIIRAGLLREAIEALRNQFQLADSLCDERIIDWLLWGWVSILRRAAQQRGDALYD